jgi:hypothetical protein
VFGEGLRKDLRMYVVAAAWKVQGPRRQLRMHVEEEALGLEYEMAKGDLKGDLRKKVRK